MNWYEIKKAIDAAGVADDDEISSIQCDIEAGAGTFHTVRIGNMVKVVENSRFIPGREEVEGCAT